jgi:predicted nuclease with TOPRIM domain
MDAVKAGNEVVVRVLLEKGAAVDMTDNHGRSALMFTGSKGNKEVERMLQKVEAALEVTRLREKENSRQRNENAALRSEKVDETRMESLREENSRLRRENAALLEKEDETRTEMSRLRSETDITLREEISRLRNDNAALTGRMAEATRRVEVKKEFTEATVGRIQKVRLLQ